MIECEAQLKKWGNSIGMIIPKDAVAKGSLKAGQGVRALIITKKTLKVKDLFGKLKFKKSTDEIMREIDAELDSKFLD